jgi:2-amino-4-hydroxy-6-hydroxymethyldihydropteridine diphosphokinase
VIRVAIGIGSNVGDPRANVLAGISALAQCGAIARVSRLYATKPWGGIDQPHFCNAAVLLDTDLAPGELLRRLKDLEARFGREASERWGPRVIDFDILSYGEESIDEPGLTVPHARLYERAFALVPLAEIDERYRTAVAGLPPGERESVALMSEPTLADRVRTLAQAFLETDLVRLRIEEPNEDSIELRRRAICSKSGAESPEEQPESAAKPAHLEAIKADLVGIFHLSRPAVKEGERVETDRELAYVEALGIRTAVRSLGAGRVAVIRVKDGEPVEYGQVLFEIDRA